MLIKVLLVEDHEIVREGLKALLEAEKNIKIAGEASNGREALFLVKASLPDVVLMDVNMPVMNGIEATQLIKKEFPEVKVLILSMHDHESYLIDMLDAGANGYVIKNCSREELIFAIKKVASDGVYIGPEFTLGMLAKYKNSSAFNIEKNPDISLSDYEIEVLQLVAEGLTNVEMAQKLHTSVRTIETRRKRLQEKTKTSNTATLIRFAVLNGLIK